MRDEDIHIGDTLYVREWEEMLQEGYLTDRGSIALSSGAYFPREMRRICGISFTVKSVDECSNLKLYASIEQTAYYVTAQMLKPDPFDEIQFEVTTDDMLEPLEEDFLEEITDEEFIKLLFE